MFRLLKSVSGVPIARIGSTRRFTSIQLQSVPTCFALKKRMTNVWPLPNSMNQMQRLTFSSADAPKSRLQNQDQIREHVRNQYALYNKSTKANILPVDTYKASYLFNPYPINFNIYYHYITVAGLRFSNLCFRYFDRGLLELLGPYGIVKAFSYAAFKLELMITGYIPHYFFYAVSGFLSMIILLFSPLNVPLSLILLFGYLFMAL